MIYGFETFFTIALAMIGFLITVGAQARITSAYNKYRKKGNEKRLSGQEVARKILDENGLMKVHVVEVKGELTDHYDPTNKVVRLSTEVFHGESIASLSVAAHECGHAIQDKTGYALMKFRSAIVPIVNFISYAGYFVTLISAFFGAMVYLKIGIFILLSTLLFQLVTLPVEFDASKRAKEELKRLNLTSGKENDDVKDMLYAAALTYVAGLTSTVLNVFRMMVMARNEKDRRR